MMAATGVLVAAIFYILNLRVQQENMRQTLQTRQAQLFSSIYHIYTTKEMEKAYWAVGTMKFQDVDDWNELKKDEEKRAE
jgi:adenylosuccinate lyase